MDEFSLYLSKIGNTVYYELAVGRYRTGELTYEERFLNAGRFKNYSKKDLPNWITIKLPESIILIIEWIANNISNKWCIKYTFSIWLFNFESDIDAMHFALRWKHG